MTDLKKPVTRRVQADHGRVSIAVTIFPHGVLGFREKGSRRGYTLSIMGAYYMAVKQNKED